MKISTSILFVVLLLISSVTYAQRGTVVNATPMGMLSPTDIMQNLQLNLDETNYALIDYFTYKNYSVNAVKIIYNTIDGQGNPTTASGVVFIPEVGCMWIVYPDAYERILERFRSHGQSIQR